MNCPLVETDGRLVCKQCGFSMRFRPGRVLRNCDNEPAPEAASTSVVIQSPKESGEFVALVTESDLPCIYRSGPPQAVQCKPCENRGQTLLVFGCSEHGACTLQVSGKRRKAGERYQACQTCEDRADA